MHQNLPTITHVRATASTRNPHSLAPETPRVVHVRLSYAYRRPKPFNLAAIAGGVVVCRLAPAADIDAGARAITSNGESRAVCSLTGF